MKKFFALFMALMMVCLNAGLAEGIPQFATMGEVFEAAGESPTTLSTYDYYTIALEINGRYFRYVADMDDNTRALSDAIDNTDVDHLMEAFDALDEGLKQLPVSYVEEFTVLPLAQEELDALTGKTIGALYEEGFQSSESGGLGEAGEIVAVLARGVYQYAFIVDADNASFLAAEENGTYEELTVRDGKFAGLSRNAAELRFHADGVVEEEVDGFAVFNEIMALVTDAYNAAEDGKLDKEALIASLLEKFPDQEEAIRAAVDMLVLIQELGITAPEEGETGAENGKDAQ